MVTLVDAPKRTLTKAARRLDLHPQTLRRWARHGVNGRKLPTVTIGGRLYVLDEDLEAFLAAGRDDDTRREDADERFEQQAAVEQQALAARLGTLA